jgi:hypothetical protein
VSDLQAEKNIRAQNLFGNDAAIAEVTTWRKPDRVFDGELLELDHGDRGIQPGFNYGISRRERPGTRLWLLWEVNEAVRLGLTSTPAIEAITLGKCFLVSRFNAASGLNPLLINFRRLNVLST